MEFTTNLHTHTHRCNHASGTEREYIENAIAGGIKTLGFSDHAPYLFADGYRSGYRMLPSQQDDYVETLLSLREEYKGRIDIKIGYEMEYFPAHFEETLAMIRAYPIDYLILGQHFTANEYDGAYSGQSTDDEKMLKSYVDQVIEGMATGCFTYLAHPDLCYYTGDDAIYEKHYSRLIESAKSHHLPLEFNLYGFRDHRKYPCEKFWKLCGELEAEVCFGSDAHAPQYTADLKTLGDALVWAERFDLCINPAPELVRIK